MELGLAGKWVLVTGSSQGIGLACARAFAAEGAHVHLAARSRERMERAARELSDKYGTLARTHTVDLRSTGSAERLAEEVGAIDVLVNNAGDIPSGALGAIDESTWRHAWELKVFGFINLTRTALAAMQERGRGVIVNVIGMGGVVHPADYACGAAGNAALDAFTKAVGKGSPRHGVRVLGVHPGATRTERLVAPLRALAKQRLGDESRWPELLRGQRLQEPEQVADTVVFLASERAAHLSGVMLSLTPA